jgi:hypothetical protein
MAKTDKTGRRAPKPTPPASDAGPRRLRGSAPDAPPPPPGATRAPRHARSPRAPRARPRRRAARARAAPRGAPPPPARCGLPARAPASARPGGGERARGNRQDACAATPPARRPARVRQRAPQGVEPRPVLLLDDLRGRGHDVSDASAIRDVAGARAPRRAAEQIAAWVRAAWSRWWALPHPLLPAPGRRLRNWPSCRDEPGPAERVIKQFS